MNNDPQSNSKIRSMADLAEAYDEHVAELKHIAERRDNTLVMRIEGRQEFEYVIGFERIDTAPKVLDWILHLTGKTWVTPKHIRALVSTAVDLGAEIERNA